MTNEMMTYMFKDRNDIGMRFVIAFIFSAEIFTGFICMIYYKENKKWFDNIAKRIKAMPTILMLYIMWYIVYFSLGFSINIFYRDSEDIIDTYYVLDVVTILFIINIILNKIYPFMFFRSKKAFISLMMMVCIVITSIALLYIFYIHNKLTEFWFFLPYTLWNMYLFYINFMFVYIEKNNIVQHFKNIDKKKQQKWLITVSPSL